MESHRGGRGGRGGSRGGFNSGGHRGGRGGYGGGGSKDVGISKTLSWILRHGAVELKLNLRQDGYVPLSEILDFHRIKCKIYDPQVNKYLEMHVTLEDIERIVENNDKKRF